MAQEKSSQDGDVLDPTEVKLIYGRDTNIQKASSSFAALARNIK